MVIFKVPRSTSSLPLFIFLLTFYLSPVHAWTSSTTTPIDATVVVDIQNLDAATCLLMELIKLTALAFTPSVVARLGDDRSDPLTRAAFVRAAFERARGAHTDARTHVRPPLPTNNQADTEPASAVAMLKGMVSAEHQLLGQARSHRLDNGRLCIPRGTPLPLSSSSSWT